MNNRFKQSPYQLVSQVVTTTGQTVNLTDQPQLRNTQDQRIKIKMIEIITTDCLTFDPNNTGIAISPNAELQKATLVLYDNGWNKVYQLPLMMLNHLRSATTPANEYPREFNDLEKVDWNKSQIVFVTAPNPTPNYSIVLGVSYSREELNPQTGAVVKIDD